MQSRISLSNVIYKTFILLLDLSSVAVLAGQGEVSPGGFWNSSCGLFACVCQDDELVCCCNIAGLKGVIF